jgi:non-specific serine/threonine protein kinase
LDPTQSNENQQAVNVSHSEHNTAALVEPLTRREREVLGLLAQGLTAPEMAEQLTLAVSSVKWHIQQLYGKLGVNGKRQAVGRARELGLLGATTPVTQPPSPSSNLPLQVTRFFGREAELAQITQHLAADRLVTLTGPGGVGKTRLALRAADELLLQYPQGVWFVELAALSGPGLVAQQVATTLGLRDEPGRPVLETLVRHLRERQSLIVLDNCEHVLDDCAHLCAALLRTCPRLRVLACSREPLGVAGEVIYLVPSLPFPEPGQPLTAVDIEAYAAVRLFVDRARLVRTHYEVAAHNAPAIAAICRRVDGIPLAIEMAAARVNILTPQQLAHRLDNAFGVLSGGSRTALPRQQTLRATIDWSYNLLSEPEQRVLQRLSVFAGGCTLEAAEAVCAGEAVPAEQVLDLLGALVAKSMVVADQPPGEAMRYRLLEMIRQYAREKLEAAGERPQALTRQRDYYLAFVEADRGTLSTTEQLGGTPRQAAVLPFRIDGPG